MTQRIPTVGVFDSGVGGLTVLKSLLTQASAADYLYLGDTARLPYGSKSRATVARYAVSSARFLVEQGAATLSDRVQHGKRARARCASQRS